MPRPLLCAALLFWLKTAPALFGQSPQTRPPSDVGRPPSSTPLDDPFFQEILENISKRNLLNPDFDAGQLVEHLEDLTENPLDLNRADRAELENLWLLTAAQVAALLFYREKMGPLAAVEELVAVPGWSVEDVRAARPFLMVEKGTGDWAGSRKSLVFNGSDDIRLRTTYRHDNQNPEAGQFAGPPVGHLLRWRHTNSSRASYGLAADTDPGERFFRKENRQGFDFYSAHFFVKGWSRRVRTVALGDYKLSLGQGLVMGAGFSMGKSSSTLFLKKGGAAVRPHTAGGEDFFLRGAAAVFEKKGWEAALFASHRRRDAAFFEKKDTTAGDGEDGAFGDLATGGLHRLPSEIENEKRVGESLAGLSLHRSLGRWRAGLNNVAARFSQPVFAEKGGAGGYNSLIANSLDYSGGWRNWSFFGEAARSSGSGWAVLNAATVAIDRRLTVAFLQRNYGPGYRPLYANAFGETRDAANERGLYTGIEWRPVARWRLNGFVDIWRHPLARAGSLGPSGGREWLASATFLVRKKGQVQAILRHETHDGLAETGPVSQKKRRLRLQSNWKLSRPIEWRARAEATRFTGADGARARGFLTFQEIRWHPLGRRFTGAARLTAFETTGPAVRMYSFEQQLIDSQLVPSYSGKGSRIGLRGDFQLGRGRSVGLFAARTAYLFPKGRTVWEVRAQARAVF